MSLQLWEGCPGKPTLVLSIVQSIQEIRMNFCHVAVFSFFLVFILKPTLPELCPFTGCFLLMLEFWPGLLNRYRFLLTYSAILHHTNSFFYYSSVCTVHIKAWQVWDEGFCHLLGPEKNSSGPAWKPREKSHRSVILLRTQIRNSSSVYWRLCGDGNKWGDTSSDTKKVTTIF